MAGKTIHLSYIGNVHRYIPKNPYPFPNDRRLSKCGRTNDIYDKGEGVHEKLGFDNKDQTKKNREGIKVENVITYYTKT